MPTIFRTTVTLLLFWATGCATIPNAAQLATEPTGNTPAITGSTHDLTPAQAARAMAASP